MKAKYSKPIAREVLVAFFTALIIMVVLGITGYYRNDLEKSIVALVEAMNESASYHGLALRDERNDINWAAIADFREQSRTIGDITTYIITAIIAAVYPLRFLYLLVAWAWRTTFSLRDRRP